MWKDDDASRRGRRREIPVAATLQPLDGSALPHLNVLGAVELVDPLLELLTVESPVHARDADYGSDEGPSGASRPIERATGTLRIRTAARASHATR